MSTTEGRLSSRLLGAWKLCGVVQFARNSCFALFHRLPVCVPCVGEYCGGRRWTCEATDRLENAKLALAKQKSIKLRHNIRYASESWLMCFNVAFSFCMAHKVTAFQRIGHLAFCLDDTSVYVESYLAID